MKMSKDMYHTQNLYGGYFWCWWFNTVRAVVTVMVRIIIIIELAELALS